MKKSAVCRYVSEEKYEKNNTNIRLDTGDFHVHGHSRLRK